MQYLYSALKYRGAGGFRLRLNKWVLTCRLKVCTLQQKNILSANMTYDG